MYWFCVGIIKPYRGLGCRVVGLFGFVFKLGEVGCCGVAKQPLILVDISWFTAILPSVGLRGYNKALQVFGL